MSEFMQARLRFAEKLRELRQQRDLTQEQLAEKIGKTIEHISFLERGERSPSFEAILELARALSVSVASLLENQEVPVNLSDSLGIAPIRYPLPEPATPERLPEEQRLSDIERLNNAFSAIREAQKLADEYGIRDILQDNGGKVLQVLILLGLTISPGREGNDAVDAEGNEYELKTINVRLTKSVSTHHHLNEDIIAKYRKVRAWYFAIYEDVELKEIYKVLPSVLESLFAKWEDDITRNKRQLNNPKIPLKLVRTKGELVYPPNVTQTKQSELQL